MNYKYYAVIEKGLETRDGGFIVSFPDLENVFTDGDSMLEAVENAHDALRGMLAVMEEKQRYCPS